MSKPLKPVLFAGLLVSALLAGLFLTSTGSAQRTPGAQQNPVATKTARNAALVAATQSVLRETSEIRQLAILRTVQSSTQSRAEIERMITRNLAEDSTPADMHADEVTLKKFGLAPADFRYEPFLINLLTEQVAGYYDPKTHEFHLADWIDLDGQKPIMAHELTHALQDQHFNLRRFEHWPKGDSDAQLAVHALIEGDATLTMMLYIASDPMRAVTFLKSLSATGMASSELEKAPRGLRETLLFPYQEGTDWTRSLFKEGGWARVSRAYTELPQSTEQILHVDKYFAREAPVKVTLPDITSLLNASNAEVSGQRSEVRSQRSEVSDQRSEVSFATGTASVPPASRVSSPTVREGWLRYAGVAGSADVPPALSAKREPFWSAATSRRFGLANHAQVGSSELSLLPPTPQPLPPAWKRIDYDVNGEWCFYLILDQFLKSPAESRRAAAGWGGDRYEVYEGPKGEVLIASLSTWDTERDAREFFNAYVKRTELRYPGAERLTRAERLNPSNSEVQTPNSKLETRNSYSWRTSEGTVVIELRGSRVVILEGVADRLDANTLLKAL